MPASLSLIYHIYLLGILQIRAGRPANSPARTPALLRQPPCRALPSPFHFAFCILHFAFIIASRKLWLKTKNTFTTRARSRRSPRWNTSACAPACTSAASATARIATTAATSCSRRSWTTPWTNSSWATARRCRSPSKATRVSVRDFGRGIPLGKVVDCVSKINTGAKYNDDVFQFSVGLNGVGTKAVNALVKGIPGAQPSRRRIRRGVVQDRQTQEREERQGGGRAGRHVHSVRAGPGDFQGSEFRPEHVERRLRHYSYLNTGLKLIYNGPDRSSSRNGLLDLVLEDLRRGQRRADLSAAALRRQDAGILFHAQQQPLRRDVLSRSSTASTPATAARI